MLEKQIKASIVVGVKSLDLARPVIESLKGIPVRVYNGSRVNCFSKLINEIIVSVQSDVIIFCSHRVRPTIEDMQFILDKISEGYGLVMLRKLACFGFPYELIKRIGFFDERFVPGGYEDDDFYLRLKEADIAIYDEERVKYFPGTSLWSQPLIEQEGVEFKQPITYNFYKKKWRKDEQTNTMIRTLEEMDYCYKLPPVNREYIFKSFSKSVMTLSLPNIRKEYLIENKKILILGGTGSLGIALIKRYAEKNDVHIFSRDENKHWLLKQKLKQYNNLYFHMGDIRNYDKVSEVICRVSPHIIIIAAALKHIDICEYEVLESYNTNTLGPLNVLKLIQSCTSTLRLPQLHTVVYVSSDKACHPINTYGMCKALAEKAIVECAYKLNMSPIKFLNVRYGNVLNSRGSIIPKLKQTEDKFYTLTHPDMTRFIMTQEDAVELINYAILNGQSGDTIISKIKCMKISDLLELFSEKFEPKKEIKITKIRPGEKMSEMLLSPTELSRTIEKESYYIIKPYFNMFPDKVTALTSYDSADIETCLSKEELKEYLISKNLF